MSEPLDYAPPLRLHHRRWVVVLLILPALMAAYVLAVPRFKAFRARQAKRSEVRADVRTELALAAKNIAAGDMGAAAIDLLHADFARQVDAHLFGQSELDRFDRDIAAARTSFQVARADAWMNAWLTNVRVALTSSRGQIVRKGCSFPGNLQRTIAALRERAEDLLAKRNVKLARTVCEQIIELDRHYEFDAAFWSHVAPPPP